MQGHALAYQVIISDDETASLAFEFHILRLSAQDGMLENAIARSQRRKPFNDGVSGYLAAFANDHIILYDGIRPHAHACA
jgi:hypothetical protein